MDNKSDDIFGVKPFGEALNISVKGISNFLSKVCLPVAEELGLLFKDKVRIWRLSNIIKILEMSNGKYSFENGEIQLKIHPRVCMDIIEKSSWIDNHLLQEKWAGLLASSCNVNEDDENVIYADLLNKLNERQVKILDYWAVNSEKFLSQDGVLEVPKGIIVSTDDLFNIVGTTDKNKITYDVNHLVGLGLVDTGFGLACGFFNESENKNKNRTLKFGIRITPIALSLYVKCNGYRGGVDEYFDILPTKSFFKYV